MEEYSSIPSILDNDAFWTTIIKYLSIVDLTKLKCCNLQLYHNIHTNDRIFKMVHYGLDSILGNLTNEFVEMLKMTNALIIGQFVNNYIGIGLKNTLCNSALCIAMNNNRSYSEFKYITIAKITDSNYMYDNITIDTFLGTDKAYIYTIYGTIIIHLWDLSLYTNNVSPIIKIIDNKTMKYIYAINYNNLCLN
jgi:hypothetical protein